MFRCIIIKIPGDKSLPSKIFVITILIDVTKILPRILTLWILKLRSFHNIGKWTLFSAELFFIACYKEFSFLRKEFPILVTNFVRQRTLNSARHVDQIWHCRRRKFWILLNFRKSTPSLSVLVVICNPILPHDTNCHWRTFRLFSIMIMNFQIINWLSINFKALRDVTRYVRRHPATVRE